MLGQENEQCNDQRARAGLPPACGPSVTSAFPTARPSQGKGSQSQQLTGASEGPGERGAEAACLQAAVTLDGLGVKSREGAGRDRRGRRERKGGDSETLGWPDGAPPQPREPQASPGTESSQPQSLSNTSALTAPQARVRVQDDDVGTDLQCTRRGPATSLQMSARAGLPGAGGPSLLLVAHPRLQ